jgi:purine-binding chemotaxis protein CheW
VTFGLGDDLFAADIFSVERVLRYQAPTPVPDAPGWLAGMIEYQGRVLPVINLRARFGMTVPPPRAETRILVLNAGGEWIGAIVDSVLEVAGFEPEQLSAPPPFFRGLAAEYLTGIVRRKERLVMVLDVDRLLSTTDRIALEGASAAATRRD